MASNPEEFFDEAPKWRFIFADRFRDTMTESEKGAIHGALKEVRRKEFEHKVMRTLLDDDLKERTRSAMEQQVQLTRQALAMSSGTFTYGSAENLNAFNQVTTKVSK
jgi:hypothetical protein